MDLLGLYTVNKGTRENESIPALARNQLQLLFVNIPLFSPVMYSVSCIFIQNSALPLRCRRLSPFLDETYMIFYNIYFFFIHKKLVQHLVDYHVIRSRHGVEWFFWLVCIIGEYVNWCFGAINTAPLQLRRAMVVIKINHNNSNVIVKMAPYTLLYPFYIIISHFPLLSGLI